MMFYDNLNYFCWSNNSIYQLINNLKKSLPTPFHEILCGFLTSNNLRQLANPSGCLVPCLISLPCSNESTSSQGYHTAKQWKVCFIKKAILPNYRSPFTFDYIISAHLPHFSAAMKWNATYLVGCVCVVCVYLGCKISFKISDVCVLTLKRVNDFVWVNVKVQN